LPFAMDSHGPDPVRARGKKRPRALRDRPLGARRRSSIETLIELVRACGFDLPLELAPDDPKSRERLRKNVLLSPERRVAQQLQARGREGREVTSRERQSFDPRAILGALESRHVIYILIGGLARMIQAARS
jgi:hypothetical protein